MPGALPKNSAGIIQHLRIGHAPNRVKRAMLKRVIESDLITPMPKDMEFVFTLLRNNHFNFGSTTAVGNSGSGLLCHPDLQKTGAAEISEKLVGIRVGECF